MDLDVIATYDTDESTATIHRPRIGYIFTRIQGFSGTDDYVHIYSAEEWGSREADHRECLEEMGYTERV